MSLKNLRPWQNFSTDRVKSFSDGVFSIVITLLVLELHVPSLLQASSGRELGLALLALWPKLLTYIASFVVIGIYWIAHHNLFHYVQRSTRSILWINNFYLMSVSLIAFSADMLGSYPENKMAVLAYGLNLVMVGIFLNLLWYYAAGAGLIVEEHQGMMLNAVRVIIRIPVVVYAIGSLLAFVNTRLSLLLYILVPIVYVTPGLLERLLESNARAHEAGQKREAR